jgi:hypothetical protein
MSGQDRVGDAIERLALSRERLRSTMMPAPQRPASHASSGSAGSFTATLAERLKDLPGAAMLLDAVRTWWAQHPLRTAGLVAAEASRKFAAPLAERNPLALILGAVVIGALLALSRPWRWALRPAIFAGLVPAIAARIMRQLPLESWLRMFASVSARIGARHGARCANASTTHPASAADMSAPRTEPASVLRLSCRRRVPSTYGLRRQRPRTRALTSYLPTAPCRPRPCAGYTVGLPPWGL